MMTTLKKRYIVCICTTPYWTGGGWLYMRVTVENCQVHWNFSKPLCPRKSFSTFWTKDGSTSNLDPNGYHDLHIKWESTNRYQLRFCNTTTEKKRIFIFFLGFGIVHLKTKKINLHQSVISIQTFTYEITLCDAYILCFLGRLAPGTLSTRITLESLKFYTGVSCAHR